MTTITETNNLGDLLKYEASNLYSRDQITVAKGQNLKLGTVVGCDTKDPSYGLADKERHRNRGLFRLHGVGNQNRKNMN